MSEAIIPLSQRARRTTEPPISWLLTRALANPNVISLAAGFVDQQSLPAHQVEDLLRRIFSSEEYVKKALQYGSTNGLTALRRLLAGRLESQGLPAPIDPEHIVLTSGSQQLLFLVTDVLCDPGDIVLVEDPTYFVYMGVLEAVGTRTLGITIDDDGIIPEALEERLEELRRAGDLPRLKALYLMTYYQNPKGTSTSWERRERIYEIIERYSTPENYIFIIEDAAYYDLRYDGEDVTYMKKLDPNNERVVLALTFSKGFAPGLRLGYGHLPKSLIVPVLNQKGNHDFGSGNFSQYIAYHALDSGYYDEHVQRLRERYSAKRDKMVQVIRDEFPRDVKYINPHGGLYVWLTLPEGMPCGGESKFFEEAMRKEVLYVPGRYCYAQEPGRPKPDNQIRLCYGYIEEGPMVEGLRRLAAVIEACR